MLKDYVTEGMVKEIIDISGESEKSGIKDDIMVASTKFYRNCEQGREVYSGSGMFDYESLKENGIPFSLQDLIDSTREYCAENRA